LFVFSEPVNIKNLKQKIIINPPVENFIIYQNKLNQIEIIFNEELQKDRTYSIDFNNSIFDLTENNPIDNYRFFISTGEQLDSFKIKGKIISTLENKIEKNFKLFLFDVCDSLLENPLYVTYSDDNGNFLIENIEEKKYFLVCTTLDKPKLILKLGQKIGFDTVTCNQLTVKSTYQNLSELKILKKEISDIVEIEYNKNPIIVNLQSKHKYKLYVIDKKVFIVPEEQISDTLIITATDSILQKKTDSIFFKSNPNLSKKKPFIHKFYQDKNKLIIELFYFAKILNTDSILINGKRVEKTKLNLDENTNISYDLNGIDSLNIIFKTNSLINSYGNTNNTTEAITWKRKKEEEKTNSICYTSKINNNNFFVELYDNQGKVVDRKKNQKNSCFYDIPPGVYKIRILIDNDNNGFWDPGNIHIKRKSEPVIHFDKEITIRENWEIKDIHIE
jgi:hypothetical protein